MKGLDDDTIYQSLCYKDKRNPFYIDLYDKDENPEPRKDCCCDNCFYQRDRLALEVIRLKQNK